MARRYRSRRTGRFLSKGLGKRGVRQGWAKLEVTEARRPVEEIEPGATLLFRPEAGTGVNLAELDDQGFPFEARRPLIVNYRLGPWERQVVLPPSEFDKAHRAGIEALSAQASVEGDSPLFVELISDPDIVIEMEVLGEATQEMFPGMEELA